MRGIMSDIKRNDAKDTGTDGDGAISTNAGGINAMTLALPAQKPAQGTGEDNTQEHFDFKWGRPNGHGKSLIELFS